MHEALEPFGLEPRHQCKWFQSFFQKARGTLLSKSDEISLHERSLQYLFLHATQSVAETKLEKTCRTEFPSTLTTEQLTEVNCLAQKSLDKNSLTIKFKLLLWHGDIVLMQEM